MREQKLKYQKSEKGRIKHNEAHNRWKKKQKRRSKQDAVDYKGGKCSICGYDKCIAALEFHHLIPSQKEYNVGQLISLYYKWNKIKKELDKCILLCANCHRELHYNKEE